MKAKDFDKKFDNNKVDIIDDLDLSTIKRPNPYLSKFDHKLTISLIIYGTMSYIF